MEEEAIIEEEDGASIPNKPTIENLVFRGGGVKGIAYCGALRVLSEQGMLDNVKRYAGSSAGAITAALLAVGYTIEEMENTFRTLDMLQFKDSKGSLIAKAERLYKKFALYEGNYFFTWMTGCIEKKTNPNITFKELKETFGKELVIVGACISHMEVVYFNYKEFPDMPIRDALRISMSIPIMFEPVRIQDHVYVDGGLADNFPLFVFDSEENTTSCRHANVNMKTLGMFLQENKTREAVTRDINKIKDFMECLLDTVKLRIATLAIKPGDSERTMYIQTHHIRATDFDISEDEKNLLYDEGQKAARLFVAKFVPSVFEVKSSPTWGRLIVQLKNGVGIHTRRLSHNLHSVLTLGQISKKTTSIRSNKSNPKWEENFVFPVLHETEIFKVEVFEGTLLGPRLIGCYEAPVNDYKNHHCVETKIDTGKGVIIVDITLSIYYP